MTFYNFVLFFHILSMMGLAMAVVFHWSMLRGAATASADEEALRSVRGTILLPRLLFPSLLTVLATGVYMTAHIRAFGRGWISASLLAILLIAVVSAFSGPKTRALQRYAVSGDTGGVREAIRGAWLIVPLRLQMSLLLSIIFLMVARTNLSSSLAVVVVGVAAGLAWSAWAWRGARSEER